MKKWVLFWIMILYPISASAMTGVVSKVDVCGIGNVIFRTSSGLYVNALHLSGEMFQEGASVSGKLKTYGVQIISTPTGQKGNYYILDFKSSRIDAINAHCRPRMLK